MKKAWDETSEHLLRELAPQVLGSVARRFRDFSSAEDAVQLRPLRTREVTALEVESQINSRNSRRVRPAVYSSRIAVTGFRLIARRAGK
jgi:hypothetical protein